MNQVFDEEKYQALYKMAESARAPDILNITGRDLLMLCDHIVIQRKRMEEAVVAYSRGKDIMGAMHRLRLAIGFPAKGLPPGMEVITVSRDEFKRVAQDIWHRHSNLPLLDRLAALYSEGFDQGKRENVQ